MKGFAKLVILGGLLAASAAPAMADTINISVGGSDNFNSTTITFGSTIITSGMVNGNAYTPFTTAINFTTNPAGYTPNFDFGINAVGVQGATFAAPGGGTITFFYTSEKSTFVLDNGSGISTLELSGTGYFMYNGNRTNASYDLTSQEVKGTTSMTSVQGSFSGSTNFAATPEPNSLVLLGTGLLGAAGVAFRKRGLVS